MSVVALKVRPALMGDQRRLSDLLFTEEHVHRHLDWRPPLSWLGGPHFWVMEEGRRLLAAMACPQDPPGIAWVRIFVFAAPLVASEAWSPLWQAAHTDVAEAGGALVAAIAVKTWFQAVLEQAGFHKHQSIVLLEWEPRAVEHRPLPEGLHLRPMQREDLAAVAEVDADAFDPLWTNSIRVLEQAFSQAASAVVAELSGRLVGYQVSTGNAFGNHLGRLAVRRDAQRRGVGEALLRDLMLGMRRQGAWRLTVNTQDDNDASLRLYMRMGFVRTGESYPVYLHEIGKARSPA